MPTYDYVCKDCGEMGEKNVSLAHFDDLQECPKCHKMEWERQFSPSAKRNFDIVGFCYENNYGKKAWKRNLSPGDQSKVLTGERAPY